MFTLGMCALTADGGAAAVVCNDNFLSKHNNLQKRAIGVFNHFSSNDGLDRTCCVISN